jgi:hypothetical protein
MKKTLTLAMIMLLLAGCQYGLFQSKSTMSLPEVKVGNQGVEIYFTPYSPPPEVYENSKFTMLTTLSNLGATDVDEGVFSISYEPQYLYTPKQQGRFIVRGKSEFIPQGMETQVNLPFTTKALGPQLQGYTTTITFNACYPYVTNAAIIVCIDTDLTGKKTDKVCTAKAQSFPQGQGAPVAVATVDQRMMPHEMPGRVIPEFTLTLKNQGSGQIVSSPLYRDACSGRSLGEGGWNVVSVGAVLSDSPMTCAPQTVKIKPQGETKVICRVEEGIDSRLGTYTAPLSVALDYGYIASKTTQVKLLPALQQ